MPTIRLPNSWRPRPYQLPAWSAWERGIKRESLIWHRRAGKDDYELHKTAVAAHPPTSGIAMPGQRIANYWHCLPQYTQARKAIWEAINPKTGKKRIDEAFPKELRSRTDSQSMTIEFKIGSAWRVVGSDNPDSLVGAPPFGIVFSEWALSNPSAWGYLSPILAENGGWASFITTSRGRNHAYTLHQRALKSARTDGQWFAETLTVDDTGVVTPQMIEEARNDYVALFGRDAAEALIQQEYHCSFEAAILGAYWGREMVDAEREGRLGVVDHDEALPVHTAWDLGVGDDTAIWLFQISAGQIHVIDYYADSGKWAGHYVEWLEARQKQCGYRYGHDWVPHDARARDWTNKGPGGEAKTRIQTLLELGRKPRIVPDHTLDDGINAARRMLRRCRFDAERCDLGIEALRQYKREWDDDKKAFKDKPLHDWTSHAADAFRYLCIAASPVVSTGVAPPKDQERAPVIDPRLPTLNALLERQS